MRNRSVPWGVSGTIKMRFIQKSCNDKSWTGYRTIPLLSGIRECINSQARHIGHNSLAPVLVNSSVVTLPQDGQSLPAAKDSGVERIIVEDL